MKKYVCKACGWVYDEALGDPDNGIAPGTKWEDLPDDFKCPLCGVGKEEFEVYENWFNEKRPRLKWRGAFFVPFLISFIYVFREKKKIAEAAAANNLQRKELNDRINRKHILTKIARGKLSNRKVLYIERIIL